jgi:hypothetical protein
LQWRISPALFHDVAERYQTRDVEAAIRQQYFAPCPAMQMATGWERDKMNWLATSHAMNKLRALDGNERGTASMSKEANLDTLHHTALRVKDVKETVAWYTERFRCKVEYQDATWAMLEFENVRLAFVLAEQHPPHVAILGDPALFGEPSIHRDGTASVYVKDPNGNNLEILALAPEASPAAKL